MVHDRPLTTAKTALRNQLPKRPIETAQATEDTSTFPWFPKQTKMLSYIFLII